MATPDVWEGPLFEQNKMIRSMFLYRFFLFQNNNLKLHDYHSFPSWTIFTFCTLYTLLAVYWFLIMFLFLGMEWFAKISSAGINRRQNFLGL